MMSTPDPTLSSRESFGTEGSSGASDSTLMHAESSNVSTIGARPSTITSSRDPRSVSTELEDTLGSDEDDEDDLDDDDDDEGEMTAGSSAHRGKGKGRDSSSSTSPKIGTFPVEGETLGPGLTLNRAGKIVKKRNRTLTTPHQAAVLNALLAQTRFPTTEMREEVGRQIGMSARRVQIWFQNVSVLPASVMRRADSKDVCSAGSRSAKQRTRKSSWTSAHMRCPRRSSSNNNNNKRTSRPCTLSSRRPPPVRSRLASLTSSTSVHRAPARRMACNAQLGTGASLSSLRLTSLLAPRALS